MKQKLRRAVAPVCLALEPRVLLSLVPTGVEFAHPQAYDTGQTGGEMTAIDLNGDQHADAVVFANGQLTVSLANSDGTMNPATFVGASGALEYAIADLNGDHVPDVVLVRSDVSHTWADVLLGNGDGTFQAPVSYTLFNSQITSLRLFLGSVSGNGRNDIFVGNDAVQAFLPANGDGTFGTVTSASFGLESSDFAMADFNGDGKLDVAVLTGADPNEPNHIRFLPGNGDGTFPLNSSSDELVGHTSYSVQLKAVDVFPSTVYAAPVVPSLIVPNYYDGTVTVFRALFERQDTTHFAGWTSQTLTVGANPIAADAADVNGDGTIDIAVLNNDLADKMFSVSVLPQNPDGTFRLARTVTIPDGLNIYQAQLGNSSLALADVNGDGLADLLLAGNYTPNFQVMINDHFHTIGFFTTQTSGSVTIYIFNVNGTAGNDVIIVTGTGFVASDFYATVNGQNSPDFNTNMFPANPGQFNVYANVQGFDGNDTIDCNMIGIVQGGNGNDSITAGSLVTAYGNAGNDTLMGTGPSELIGGAGDDLIMGANILSNQGINFLWGGIGNDTIIAGYGNNVIYGNAGNDVIHTTGSPLSNNTIYGGAGDDIIYTANPSNDTVYGGQGNDTLHGQGTYVVPNSDIELILPS